MEEIEQRRISSGLVRKLVTELYTDDIAEITRVNNGETNYVFFVSTFSRGSDVVVRISEDQAKINDYLKEQWCIVRANEANVPSPVVLEVSNHIVPYPYSVVKFKKGTPGNLYEGDKNLMYRQMGELLKKIHSIKTSGYGKIFDWSHNQLSKIQNWEEYLKGEFNIDKVFEFYQNKNILYPDNLEMLEKALKKIRLWEFQPILCHNDYLPKNILINKKSSITAIIDWELAISCHPYRDIGKTLRGMDFLGDREYFISFLEGYGISQGEYSEKKLYMFIFDLLYNMEEIRKVYLEKDDVDTEKMHELIDFLNSFFTDEFVHPGQL